MSISDEKLDDVDHLLSPDIIYTVPGTHPLAGVFRGPAEVKRHLADLLALTTRTYDVLKWADWMVGESHIAVLQYLQVQRAGAVYRGHQLFLVQSDSDGLLSDIHVYFEDEGATDEFFSR
jgi:ketosteroid isomerase-like protein